MIHRMSTEATPEGARKVCSCTWRSESTDAQVGTLGLSSEAAAHQMEAAMNGDSVC